MSSVPKESSHTAQRWIKSVLDIYLIPILIPSILLTCSVKYSSNGLSPIYNMSTSGSIVSTLTLAALIHVNAQWRLQRATQTMVYSFILLASSYFGYLVHLILNSDLDINQTRENFQNDVVALGTGKSYSAILLPTLIIWFQVFLCVMTFLTIFRYRWRKFYFGESFILSQCISSFCSVWTATTLLSNEQLLYRNRPRLFNNYLVEQTTHVLLDSGAITATTLLVLKLSNKLTPSRALRNFLAYVTIASSLVLIYLRASTLLNEAPITWLVGYIFATHQRLSLFSLWVSTVAGCVAFSIAWSQNSTGTNSIIRKVFHAVICMIFITGYKGDMGFTSFAAGATLLAFILLETFRVLRLKPIGQYLEKVCRTLRSGHDNSSITINHIYLLMGLFLPVWLLPMNSSKLSISSGLIAVGIGDTFAALIGTMVGRNKITATNKTLEGFLGGLLSQIVFKLWWIGFQSFQEELTFLIASAMVSFAELFILYDNLALSLVMTLLTTCLCH